MILYAALLQIALAAAPARIDVVTLNTWGLPEPIARDRAGRFPLIKSWLDAANADIVGLQEVWRGAGRLLDLVGIYRPPNHRDTGLMIASRWAVRDVTVTPYRAERGIDAWKSKGILEAIVDAPSGALRVFVTHLQAGSGCRNATVRRAQVDQLVARVDAAREPTLVMGDFNLYADNLTDRATWTHLVAAGLADAATHLGRDDVTFDRLGQRFDRVLFRGNGDTEVTARDARVIAYDDDPTTAAPPVLSDHHPVIVELEVRR